MFQDEPFFILEDLQYFAFNFFIEFFYFKESNVDAVPKSYLQIRFWIRFIVLFETTNVYQTKCCTCSIFYHYVSALCFTHKMIMDH